jgi:DNA replication protein DnaC
VSDVDAAKLPVMLNALRLPTIGRIWQEFGARADCEGWGSARFLAAMCDHELAERAARRIARHMADPACRTARPSPPSTSPPCQPSAKPT